MLVGRGHFREKEQCRTGWQEQVLGRNGRRQMLWGYREWCKTDEVKMVRRPGPGHMEPYRVSGRG